MIYSHICDAMHTFLWRQKSEWIETGLDDVEILEMTKS